MEEKERRKILRKLMKEYKSLKEPVPPKTLFVRKLMKECDVSKTTAYNWVLGLTAPKKDEHIAIIGRILEEESV